MSQIEDAIAALKAALANVEQLDGRIYEDLGFTVTGVSAIITPPTLTWGSFGRGDGPTEATFVVHLAVPFDEYATARLYPLVEPMRDAIEADPLFTVASASPALLQQGGAQLPTYALTVDVGL